MLNRPVSGCSFECHKEVQVKSCCPGFWGPDCIECPESADRPCNNRGVCSDGLGGNGTCSCQVGFAGTACEDCASDRYGPTCSSVCSCVHGICGSGLKGSGSCLCFSGYTGPNCDQELPECVALSCQQNSRCIEEALTGKFVCQCLLGYQRSGAQCVSINPCLQRICHAQASCVHTGPNQHLCACNEGYSGDGRVCMAVDPCQNKRGGCAAESTRCVYDGPGKSHCECLPGFDLLSNGSCSLIDSCRPDSCHKNANCTMLSPGRIKCTCLPGYIGNGEVCYGNIIQRLKALNTQPGGQWSGQLSSLSWPLQNLGPFTLFVPINKGFRGVSVRKTLPTDLPKAKYLCQMHLVAGVMPFDTLKKTNIFYTLTGKSLLLLQDSQTKIRIHGSRKKGTIIQSDMVASNGMIHIINKLMDSVSPTVESDTQVSSLIKLSDRFIDLLKADLASVLDLPGPITVFAPSSSAFDSMTEGHLQYLSSSKVRTKLNRSQLGQILVNEAAVLEAAVEAKNGRLYVLDGVLTPPSIQPVLPHRCDINETKIFEVSFYSSGCHIIRTNYDLRLLELLFLFVQTPTCCKGFYGPDCSPCPGGYQTPCSGHGQCLEGIGGNGSCICESKFRGSRCQYCSSSDRYGPNCDRTCPCIHGQCDNRPDSDGRCKVGSCLSGFTGPFCERRTAVCGIQVQFCHAHADCDFSKGTTRCVCKPGYQGDGITCVESDPCALPQRGGCSVNAKCIKTGPGSHSCQCLTGWREDGDECQPINNCDGPDRGGCHPNGTCIYIGPGQSDCMCKSGYKGNGQDCEAVNQCVTAAGTCHYLATCRLLSFQWTCVCNDEYTGNGHICYGTVQQVRLINTDDHVHESTSAFISSRLCSFDNITLLVPSSAAIAKMSSEDINFWTTKGNLPSLVRSFKQTFGSETLIIFQLTAVGGATITTPNLAATNGLIHIIDKVLVPERKLSEGLLATLALTPDFSLFRSYLIDYNLMDEIEQMEEFTVFAPTNAAIADYLRTIAATALDVNTTRYHVVASERLLETDLQSGGYKKTLLGFSFQLGIYPRDGKLFVNDAQINSSNILSINGVIHSLSAVLRINRNRCDEAKQQKIMVGSSETCRPEPLSPLKLELTDSLFSLQRGPVKCMLSRMFEEERLLSIGCRATCLRTHMVLRCCGGFFGEHCELCPGPKDQPCFNNGVCSDGTNGTGVCQCNQGFSGTACETCESNKYGVHCDQGCGCKNGRCNDGLAGNGACECDVGWRGVLCDENDELCGSMKCHTSANCVIAPPLSRCICAFGFEGNGSFCRGNNTRADQKQLRSDRNTVSCYKAFVLNGGCNPNAVCKRTRPGRRECVCDRGYSGDGIVCVAVLMYVCMFQDTGVMDLVNDAINEPVTIFMPSDAAMASLPQEQKDFLFHRDNRPQLEEYLKYHILQAQKIYAEGLIHLDSVRTLQGSPLSFTCGGLDDIGEIFVNDGKCRIVQRHLIFNGGIAYGINCLLTPPSLGGRCDEQTTFELQVNLPFKDCLLNPIFRRSVCIVKFWRSKCCHGYYGRDCLVCPGGVSSPCSNRGKCDDGQLGNGTCTCDVGFGGVACELCSDGFYGPTCKACNCSEHGSCDAGRRGTGSCFCEDGWTGERCETPQAEIFQCSPPCSPKAVCRENSTCMCRPFYEGDGFTCTVMDMCQIWNGGCAKGAKCSQTGEKVSCTCPKGHTGDGFNCQPIDRCSFADNGGCHEHATCTPTAPGKSRCTCKDNYIGDGVTCEVKQLPISRCLQDNGQCHQDAKCTDLHFEDTTFGVFHFRSYKGQYKLNYTEAQKACSALGATLATYNQLSYAQQGGLNLCAAGWLDKARVAYPTTYSNPNCGFGHVGIVDYGTRKDLGETWDTFCYRMKEVKCECKPGYVGDGFSCTGNLLQVLESTPNFSNFLTQILNSSQVSESGRNLLKRLSNLTVQSTLFVPDNNGLPNNQTLSQQDIEFHLSEGQALPVGQLKNGSRIRTRVGSLTSSRYINNRFITESDILASNGIIHVLQGPLKAQPPRHEVSDVITTEFTKYTFKKRLTAKTGIACFSVVGSSDARGS
uniref:Stabilin 2 n=1 Tax=Dicentrarchus labrax TaxID=13489 RepID=A0A8C4GKP0_DICLA